MAQHSENDTHEHEHRGSRVSTYVTVALILAVITYLEFAIVEFEIGWLSAGAILFWLIVMSLIKFFFVIWWFMHLKDDEAAYSGFFGSGMAIAMGTFLVLGVLFTVPSTVNRVRAQAEVTADYAAEGEAAGSHAAEAEAAHGDEGGHGYGVSDEELELIESDGYSAELATRFDTPRPKNQRALLTLPAAPRVDVPLQPAPALFEDSEPDAAATETDGTADADAADASVTDADATDADAADAPTTDDTATDTSATDAATTDDTADTAAAATDEPADAADPTSGDAVAAQAADPLDFDAELGAQTYANCVGCHQTSGEGIPGVFPPLAGWTPTLVAADGGRAYLVSALLYGLQGEIEIDGQSYNGVMPPWAQLSDEQIAAVLNHTLTEWGNAELLPEGYAPFAADEVAAQRGAGLNANDVYELRQALELP